MNSVHCCRQNSRAGIDGRRQRTWRSQVKEAFGWVIPGALLALLPKCPLCLAAYVALGTGFTMSFSSAHMLMRALTALSIGTLALLAIRCVVNCVRNKQQFDLQLTQPHQ